FIIICLLTSMRLIEKKPDYSGTWKLNTANSNFGGLKGAAMQLTIKQYSDKLIIKRLLSANGNRDSISIDTFKFNVKKELVADMFKKHIAYTGWSDDNKKLTKILFLQHKSTVNSTINGVASTENKVIEEKTMVTWSLSEDGKALNIDQEINVGDMFHYLVKLVYDKQ
ncbi:hypothetical protein, partial [Mucilaginibacter sp.]|uniref:hypothetical protein n=1 Tax=Mucilaginibacter sp. TaxID=1882438 RepID=UPI00283E9F38